MTTGFRKFVRLICYLALAISVIALGSLIMPFALDFCRAAGGGEMACDPPVYRLIFDFGFAIVMFGAFTGVPAFLAALGIGFLMRDTWVWLRA